MHFSSFSEFLAMGGYGFYVWLSFGVTFVVMFGQVISTRMTHKRLIKDIKQEQARAQRMKDAKDMANTL